MAYNFLACDRDQAFLLPPDLREWLSADHLAWFVLDVVDQLDLHPFLAAYRADGHGRAAYEPRMLLGVLLYAYCTGVRSSRQIERRCHEDIGFRVLSGNSRPDHVTIARFRVRHEQALAGLLIQSLRLCAAAGMVRLGLVALDGTKVAANAAERANRTHAHLEAQVAELLQQAAEADELGAHAIRCNMVVPSWMWGPSVQMYVGMQTQGTGKPEEEVVQEIVGDFPLQRMTEDGEVADVVMFFASDLSKAVTGQHLMVNCGELMR
jgi:transposase